MACTKRTIQTEAVSEAMLSQQSDTLTVIESKNGLTSYRLYTPLLERYEFAAEPYMEFRRGVHVETFKDSTRTVETTLVSDYAINYENRSLWEARGNVVVVGEGGRTLYTQQLFWDQRTKRIFSNVDSKVVDADGSVSYGEGFVSDEAFKEWSFRKSRGRMSVPDSARTESTATVETRSEGGAVSGDRPVTGSDKSIRPDRSQPAAEGTGRDTSVVKNAPATEAQLEVIQIEPVKSVEAQEVESVVWSKANE